MMRARVQTGEIKFTAGADLEEVVLPNYERGFVASFGKVETLYYGSMGWGDAELKQVAAAFAFAHARGSLAQLTVSSHPIDPFPARRAFVCALD